VYDHARIAGRDGNRLFLIGEILPQINYPKSQIGKKKAVLLHSKTVLKENGR